MGSRKPSPALFWTGIGVVTVGVLWGLTQLARDAGQSVDWYSAFGGWLGAVAGVFAGAVALWIATTDRRREDNRRVADAQAEEKKLSREAGLARVATGKITPGAAIAGRQREAVTLTNWRLGNLFDIELDIVLISGKPAEVSGFDHIEHFPRSGTPRRLRPLPIALDRLVLEPNCVVAFYVPDDAFVDYAVVRYTDGTGRRWEVNSRSTVADAVVDPRTGEV